MNNKQVNIQFKDGCYRPKTLQLGKFGAKWHNDGNGFWWVSIPESRLQDLTKWYGNEYGGSWEFVEVVPKKPSRPSKPVAKTEESTTLPVVDLSDLIGAIAAEIRRIGLIREDAKKLTQDRYGKSSREMSKEELEDYLSHLKKFPDGGDMIPLRKNPLPVNGPKVYQCRYIEKGIIYLVKQWLWETRGSNAGAEGMVTTIPVNEDGSVDESKFTDIAIRHLENPEDLPHHIRKILEIHFDDKSGRSFIELWAAEKLIRQTTELMDELAEVRGVDRKVIDQEMIAWGESMKFPRRVQMTTEQLRAVVVYLTELLNPTDEDPFDYGDVSI